jgi:DNA-binding MarR family transcriptional regulator
LNFAFCANIVVLARRTKRKTIEMLSLEDQIVLALRRISQAIDVWSRQLWHDYGLTSPQLATLREILAGKNVSPVTLAAALHLSQPTVTGILGRLEQRGLIQREPSLTDRRSILAVATDKGRELAAQAPPLLRDRFRNELDKTAAWQQTEILAVLQRVAAMMHAPEIGEAPFLFNEKDQVTTKDCSSPAKRHRKTSNDAPTARLLAPDTTQPGNIKRPARGKRKTV